MPQQSLRRPCIEQLKGWPVAKQDDKEGLRDYLKGYQKEIEVEALKLARIYCIDLYELLCSTGDTIREKWCLMATFDDDSKRLRYALRILAGHSRNLSKKPRAAWIDYSLPSPRARRSREEPSWRDPAIEIFFKGEPFRIYRAIAQLKGRSRDVMSLRALGLSDEAIRADLHMTPKNFSSAIGRARRELRSILGMGVHEDRET